MNVHDHSPKSGIDISRRLETDAPCDRQFALDFEAITLASLASRRLWVAWHLESRGAKATKVPLDPATGRPARSNASYTWGTRRDAEIAIRKVPKDARGGVGIQLAELGNGERLGGIDLDTCRDPNTGEIASWAWDIIRMFPTYAEVSPSQTGVKIYFRFRTTILPSLREAMGTDFGKVWQRGGGEHPPAIELHVGNRYFAVTDQRLEGSPATIEQAPLEILRQLIRNVGPAFKSAVQNEKSTRAQPLGDHRTDEAPLKRLEKAAALSPRLRATLEKIAHYGSRSEAAMALGGALKELGWTFDEMSAVLHAHPATASWAKEKGDTADRRELRRVYERANSSTEDEEPAPWGEPDFSIIRADRRPPPELPLAVLGDEWSNWVAETAEAAAAAPDHVVANLLATASGLIGHARWAQATPGWAEPPHLWCATVGDSGTNKSAAADVLVGHVLPELERKMLGDFPDRLAEWRTKAAAAKAAQHKWEKDLHTAKNNNAAPPLPPPTLEEEEPQAPRIVMSDVTIENVASLLAKSAPKGLIIHRDELSGWLLGLNNYNDTGRQFWLEAYGGRPYRMGRQKLAQPILIPRLAVAVTGSTQPQKIAQMFSDADDGLLARFAWFWPEPRPFRLSCVAPGTEWAVTALDRLRLLDLQLCDHVQPKPVNVPLAAAAVPMMEAFGQKMQAWQEEAGGLMISALGKARGLALRLSLVLEMLRWCGEKGFVSPPTEISVEAFLAATKLVEEYLIPMAERVYGDASTTPERRNAATLARWIAKTKPASVHVRTLQRDVRLPGLHTAEAIHAAAHHLVEAEWLRPPKRGTFQRRGMISYQINPSILGS